MSANFRTLTGSQLQQTNHHDDVLTYRYDFSLIISTLGNDLDELRRLFDSILSSTCRVQVIVVDQSNGSTGVERLFQPSDNIDWVYHKTLSKGLSVGRNFALRHVTISGGIIAFPDDDCWYPPDLLEKVMSAFEESSTDILLGVIGASPQTPPQIISSKCKCGNVVNIKSTFRSPSIAIFMRHQVADAVGCFDERLGLGTQLGSGEETDYLLRAQALGYGTLFCESLVVGHPDIQDKLDWKRGIRYGLGFGAVCRKHIALAPYSLLTVLVQRLTYDLLRASWHVLTRRKQQVYYSLGKFSGRILGFLKGFE